MDGAGRRQGSAMVEAAVVFPITVLVILGIIRLSMDLYGSVQQDSLRHRQQASEDMRQRRWSAEDAMRGKWLLR